MDGGRLKWANEGRPADAATCRATRRATTAAPERDDKTHPRLPRPGAAATSRRRGQLIDVRSPAEYTGERHAHAGLSERGRAARRPHPRRRQRPLGAGGQRRGRHLQDGRRAARHLRRGGRARSRTTTSSSTAGSASAAATPGSSSPTSWATRRCATMMAAGPSGGTWSGSPSSAEERRGPSDARDSRKAGAHPGAPWT